MKNGKVLAWASAIAWAVAAAESGVAACVTPAERSAIQTRILQTDLMVAALSCRAAKDYDFVGSYNNFVRRHQPELGASWSTIKGHFRREYGTGVRSEREMDRFVTQIANDSSRRSMSSTEAYCVDATRLFEDALSAERAGLSRFSAARVSPDSVAIQPCQVAATPKAKPAPKVQAAPAAAKRPQS